MPQDYEEQLRSLKQAALDADETWLLVLLPPKMFHVNTNDCSLYLQVKDDEPDADAADTIPVPGL